MTYEIPEELRPLFEDNGKFYPDLWWWSFDTFLVKLVAIAARKLREDGHGYPCHHPGASSGCSCEQDWPIYLRSIEEDLNAYDKFGNLASSASPVAYERTQDAMRRFVDRMGAWWD